MKLFIITNCSKYGKGVPLYLQYVTVKADTEEEAIKLCEKWSKNNYSFLDNDPKNWNITKRVIIDKGVIDYKVATDYY